MYIIVVGGGNVGYGLALELQQLPDYEVTIVELSGSRASTLRDELGEMVVHGDGSEIAFLEGVGARRAELLIAVTADDGANLVTAQVARHWFKIPRVITRVNDPRNEALFRKLGVDSIVSASGAVMAQIEATMPEHTLVPLMALESAGLRVVSMRVQAGSTAEGKALRDLTLPTGVLITIVITPEGALAPDGSTVLRHGDEIIAVIPREADEMLRAMVTGAHPDDGRS
ncbi:MAG: TrkA family potassium uptake protein [Dehalococcoidia bacterium]|nr:TrkA family potassium uptake protein [Dehalococcoidia bacterium]